MSSSPRNFFTKSRSSSSISSVQNKEHDSGLERSVAAKSKEETRTARKDFNGQHSENGPNDTVNSMLLILREEKLKTCRFKESMVDSRLTHQRKLLTDNVGNITDHECAQVSDDEMETVIQRMFRKEESNDEWDFDPPNANPVMMCENPDGRQSRKGFTRINFSSDEPALGENILFDAPARKSNRFISYSYDPIPRPKRDSSRKNFNSDHHTLTVDQSKLRSMSANYVSKQQPKKKVLRHSDNNDEPALAEDFSFILDDIRTDQSRTLVSSSCSTIPRPKKRDSTRKPNFTDELMLSGDVDQILEEEVGIFESNTESASNNGAVQHPKLKDLHQKSNLAQDRNLAMDIEYILSDETVTDASLHGPTLRPQRKNFKKKIKSDDDNKAARNMDTIVEEDTEEDEGSAATGASKSGAITRLQGKFFRKKKCTNDDLSARKMYHASNKGLSSKPTSGMQAQKNLPSNNLKHADDNILDKAIDEILEIPVFDPDTSLKEKVNKILSNSGTELKSNRNSMPPKSKPVSSKKGVEGGSVSANHKKPTDYTIEELVAELFPDLLAYVLPSGAPDVGFPDASASSCLGVQTLNRDSASSVTNGDALRPLAAGSSEVSSVPFRSRGKREEKWTTGVIYTEEELKLMAQIEREYGS